MMAAGKRGDRFIGTSAFMLVNVDRDKDEPIDFYQLNLGYHLTNKDVLSIEIITWKYYARRRRLGRYRQKISWLREGAWARLSLPALFVGRYVCGSARDMANTGIFDNGKC